MLSSIISQFSIPGALLKVEQFGSGLINDTYLCEFSDKTGSRKYILQRINKQVFRLPELVMQNVEVVTEHIQGRLRREGIADPESVTPTLIRTLTGASFYADSTGEYWRMFHFIESGEVFDRVQGPRHAEAVGRGLGKFQALVSDLAPERLSDTLPGFHHTPVYLRELDDAARLDVNGRKSGAQAELEFARERRGLAAVLIRLMESKELPVRVVHNDPKVNNVMVHVQTGAALCMLDLDTVKPGLALFDFGDCVRSAANPAGEDTKDLEGVGIDLTLFGALTRGYLREAASFLTPREIGMLPASVEVITFELGIRFLADYLRGDTYFKTRYPTHNLDRARVQFKLLQSIEAAEVRMKEFVAQVLHQER